MEVNASFGVFVTIRLLEGEIKMTKKDYQAIARAIYTFDSEHTWNKKQLIDLLSTILYNDNNKFDFARFEQACTTGKCKGMKA